MTVTSSNGYLTTSLYRSTATKFLRSLEHHRDKSELDSLTYCYGLMPPRPESSLIHSAQLHVVDLHKDHDDNVEVYLKPEDTWPIDSDAPRIERDHDVYQALHVTNVPRTAPLQRSNVIATYGYESETHRFASSILVCKPTQFTGHIHYHMAVGVVGKALTRFSSSKELVSAVRDALIAHERAYEDANILHCDICPANIVITPEGGYLIDWDLYQAPKGSADGKGDATGDPNHSPRRHDRIGTWQFMSAMILLNPGRVQDRVDVLESFLHVLCWVAVRYLGNVMSMKSTYMEHVFNESTLKHGVPLGGHNKKLFLRTNSYVPDTLHFKRPSPLLQLLKDMADVFKWRYLEISEQERKNYAIIIATLVPGTPLFLAFSERNIVNQHDSAKKKLEDASWLLATLNHTLSDFTWPTDDEASLLRKRKTAPAQYPTGFMNNPWITWQH